MKKLIRFLDWGSHGIALAIAIAIAFAVQLNIRQALDAAKWVAHSQEVRVHMEGAVSAAHTIQGALSLFVIGGAVNVDAQLNSAAEKIHGELAQMRRLVADNPLQVANLAHLDGSIKTYFEFVNHVIDVSRIQGEDQARRTFMTYGQVPLDKVVEDIDAIRAEELRLLEERKEILSLEVWETTISLEVAAVLVLLLQVWAFAYARRDKRRKQEAQIALQQANERLETSVRERTAELAEANRELSRSTATAQDYAGRLQSLARQLLRLQEQERRTLALELHDQIGQQLAALKLNIQTFTQKFSQFADDKRMQDSLEIVETTIQQTRDLSMNLRPSVLDRLGLIPALKWYARHQAERAGCAVTLNADPLPAQLPPDIVTTAFRIAQEAVTNALRHGQPRHIDLVVKWRPGLLKLIVRDDGRGFDTSTALSTEHSVRLGLMGMRERAELIGGKLVIESAVGSGTEIRAELPVTEITGGADEAHQAQPSARR